MKHASKLKHLYQVPIGQRTYSMCKKYIDIDLASIIYVPDSIRIRIITPRKAKTILRYDFKLIDYIPSELLTKKIMSEIWEERDVYDFEVKLFLKHMPKTSLTAKICNECIARDPEAIQLLPSRFLTKKLWFLALQKNNKLIKLVPVSALSHSTVISMLSSNGMLIKYLPSVFKTEKARRVAIQNNPKSFRYAF